MKKLSLIALAGFLIIGGCSGDDFGLSGFKDIPFLSLKGTWKVQTFEDYEKGTSEFKTQENSWGRDIIVTFDDTSAPKVFSGQVTTNTVAGEFAYVGQRQFRISRYGTTYANQPVWADKFSDALLDGDVLFKVNNEKLRIYYDNGSKSVTLTRE